MRSIVTAPSLSGGGGGTVERTVSAITAQSTLDVTHSLGYRPIVYFTYSDGICEVLSVTHVSVDRFTYDFGEAVTGSLTYM